MRRERLSILLTSLALLFLLGGAALASNGYSLDWWTVDGGGGVSQGGSYTLQGSIGQPDAGLLNADSYGMGGGFWQSAPFIEGQVYLPIIGR